MGCGATPRAQETETKETIVRPTPFPKTAQTIAPNLRTRWLVGQPCAPPCWEGITPGLTRVDRAIDILNRHPVVTELQIYRPLLGGDGEISWSWNGADWGGGNLEFPQIDAQIAADSQDVTNPPIAWIGLSFPVPFTLAEIRAAYGDPSHVIPYVGYGGLTDGGSGGSTFYEFTVVYLEQGFLLETERELFHPPAIDPQMALSRHVVFFPPTLAGLEAVSMRDYMLPWQGFLEFVDYCAQIRPVPDAQQRCPLPVPN
jgi:hypothetical protein